MESIGYKWGQPLATGDDSEAKFPKFNYRIVADLAHELRTPMGGVMGMNELLLMQLTDPEQLMLSTVVNNSGKSLLDMLVDIVDLARFENENVVLARKIFPIDSWLRLCETSIATALASEQIAFSLSVEGEDRSCEADPSRMRQLLLCLIQGASRNVERGKIELIATIKPANLMLEIKLPPNTVLREKKFIYEYLIDQSTTRFDMVWVRLRLARILLDAMDARFNCLESGMSFELPI